GPSANWWTTSVQTCSTAPKGSRSVTGRAAPAAGPAKSPAPINATVRRPTRQDTPRRISDPHPFRVRSCPPTLAAPSTRWADLDDEGTRVLAGSSFLTKTNRGISGFECCHGGARNQSGSSSTWRGEIPETGLRDSPDFRRSPGPAPG